MLDALGYSEAPERSEAELILFNTCSIRESADNRFIAHLGEAKRLKGEEPGRVVGVGGCWAQSVKEEVFERFPFVDVAFGPGQIHRLAEFLTSESLSAQGYFEFEDFSGHLPARRERDFQGWLQISQGCNCACSYCIVPSTRGREQSRDPGELIAEAERLAADGVREVTLLGQNVNSYGRDLPRAARISFAELLAGLDAVEGIDRLRYTSPHPKDMREDVIRAHAELPALCEHIHLPLQSGSSAVLKRMRRTYGRQRYMDRVALIREHVPDCAITTDIIVGFPGESEEDFARDARGGRGGRLRRRLHLHLLAPARDRGGRSRRPGAPPGEARAHGAPGRACPAPRRGAQHALRRPHDGGPGRGAQPHRLQPPARAHPPQQDGQLRRHRRPRASWSRSRSPARPRPRSPGTSACSAGSPEGGGGCPGGGPSRRRSRSSVPPRPARPESRSSSPRRCASAARTRLRSTATRSRSTRAWGCSAERRAPRSDRGSSTGCSASCPQIRSSAPGASPLSPAPRSTACWRRGGGRSSSAAPAST